MGQRVTRLLAAVVAGALVATGIGVVLIGFAPAYLAPTDDDRQACGRGTDRDSHALVEALEHAGFDDRFAVRWQQETARSDDTELRLQAVRCGSGVEAGPVPLHPTTRRTWLEVLDTALAEDAPAAVQQATQEQLDVLAERREQLRAEQRALALGAVNLAQNIDLTEALTAEPDTVSPELHRLTTGMFADLATAETEVDDIDAEVARLTDRAAATRTFAGTAQVVPPTSPYAPLAILAVIGGLLAAAPVLRHERRTATRASSTTTSTSDRGEAGA